MEGYLLISATLFVTGIAVFLRARRVSIAGVWVQEEASGWLEILLEQRGVLVEGRCYVENGHYHFTGLWTGRHLYLRRRDFGEEMLVGKGFPRTIAQKAEGTVMAKLNLKLEEPDRLLGFFYPQRIEWNSKKTRIERRTFLDPKWRTWVRRDSAFAEEIIGKKRGE